MKPNVVLKLVFIAVAVTALVGIGSELIGGGYARDSREIMISTWRWGLFAIGCSWGFFIIKDSRILK